MANVQFLSVKLKSTFDALETKNSLALYWIEETQELYKGDKLFGTGREATTLVAGLMSAEDKAKLETLVSNPSGVISLSPVDGTISVTDATDGGKAIGVNIAPDAGNALTAVSGGLFVPTVSVPEYAIEKQETAEDGYAASYKLKMTVDGEASYVGDTINIAKDMVLKSATLEVVAEDGVPYEGAIVGDPYICMVFNDASASSLYIPVAGLVDKFEAGTGISIENNVISVKIAEDAHGLVAVDGALMLNLATKTSDGAMSKEDKAFIDAIPSVYIARKYEVSGVPYGTLVNYGEKEIRVMCPAGAEFTKQNVGVGGDANSYYMTFKTYVPDDRAVGYIEHINGQADSEILTSFSVDEFGRRYQPTWLALAKYDEAADVWNYYGKSSSVDKYIGWDYRIDWYDADGAMISTDSIRINLSNEDCHNTITPYYMVTYATKEDITEITQSMSWGEL